MNPNRANVSSATGSRLGCVFGGVLGMTKLFVLCGALCVALSTTAAFARGGGMGSHHMSGGASGTSVAAPGTNSSGTALSSGGHGSKGAPLASNPAIDREEAKVDKMIKSICRGC
jgi:hypothetical protein